MHKTVRFSNGNTSLDDSSHQTDKQQDDTLDPYIQMTGNYSYEVIISQN